MLLASASFYHLVKIVAFSKINCWWQQCVLHIVVQDNDLCCFIRCKTSWTLAPNAWLRLMDLSELLGFKNKILLILGTPGDTLSSKSTRFYPVCIGAVLGCIQFLSLLLFMEFYFQLLHLYFLQGQHWEPEASETSPHQALAAQHASAAPGGLGSCALPQGSRSTYQKWPQAQPLMEGALSSILRIIYVWKMLSYTTCNRLLDHRDSHSHHSIWWATWGISQDTCCGTLLLKNLSLWKHC